MTTADLAAAIGADNPDLIAVPLCFGVGVIPADPAARDGHDAAGLAALGYRGATARDGAVRAALVGADALGTTDPLAESEPLTVSPMLIGTDERGMPDDGMPYGSVVPDWPGSVRFDCGRMPRVADIDRDGFPALDPAQIRRIAAACRYVLG